MHEQQSILPDCLAPPTTRRTFAAIDPELFPQQRGWTLQLGQASKHPNNPLLPRDAAWDRDSNDHLFGQVVRDQRTGHYHLWHTASLIRGYELRRNHTTYASSRDGYRWARPRLGRVLFDGSDENSIWSTEDHVEHHGVAGFFEDPHDPDPERRYKRPYPFPGPVTREDAPYAPRGLHVATSPDLVNWHDTAESPIHLRRGIADTFNHGWWDSTLGKYVIITRTHTNVNGQGMRAVGRVESADFHHWSPLETVFVEREPGPSVRQYYAMPTWPYAGGYVGLLYVFHSRPRPENNDDTPLDIELAWSPDSIHWQPICKGTPLLERGAAGDFDAGRIFGLWTPIDLPHELRLYYGGVSLGKERVHALGEQPTSGVGLATFRKDGLVMLRAARAATATSGTLHFAHRFLTVNCNASRGRLRVGLTDLLGTAIPGHSLDDCDAIEFDTICHAVSWRRNADLSHLHGRYLRVVIEVDRGDFYAFAFA